jgi:hypothetical protein
LSILVASIWEADCHGNAGALKSHVPGKKVGHFARQAARGRGAISWLLDSLQREFTAWLAPIPSSYGMHVTAIARRPLDLEQVSGTARSTFPRSGRGWQRYAPRSLRRRLDFRRRVAEMLLGPIREE